MILIRAWLALAMTAASAGFAQDKGEVPPAAPPPAGAVSSGPVAESIWPGIIRWYPSAEAKEHGPASLIVQIPPARFGPAPADERVIPTYIHADGQIAAHVDIEPGTTLYGCGAVDGPLALNGRTFIAAPSVDDGAAAPTLVLPWVVAVRPDGTAVGLLADTTWRVEIDLTDGITFRTRGPALPIIVIDSDAPLGPTNAVSQVAGWQELPARWAFGTHLALSADPEAARRAATAWCEHALPADVAWLDLPDLARLASAPGDERWTAMLRDLRGLGLRPALGVHAAATPDDAGRLAPDEPPPWLLGPDGRPCPVADAGGERFVIDATRQAAREWLAARLRPALDLSIGALEVSGGSRIPDDAAHAADESLGGPGPHAKLGALDGALLARAAKDAIKAAIPDRRPLVAIASPSVISQRFAHLFIAAPASGGVRAALPALLNASISGQVVCGIDVPAAPRGADGAFLADDIAIAALLPMLRLNAGDGEHATIEPWAFSPEVERACRTALERRSRLIPYLYTVALDAYRYGTPIARPVLCADPANPALRTVTDAFLLGGDVLVRLQGAGRESILAGWKRFELDEGSGALPELLLRPGAILPIGPASLRDGEATLDPLTLIVNLGPDAQAFGTLFEDAGDGFGYLRNQARIAYYSAAAAEDGVKVRMYRLDGAMGMAKRKLHVRVLLDGGREAAADWWDGLDTTVKMP